MAVPSRGLCAIAVAFVLWVVAATSAYAQPSLLTVSDEDTTIHMLGTLHFMPPAVAWRTAEIDAAMMAADAVYFEADTVNLDPAAMQEFIIANGTNPPGVFLSDLMSQEQYQRFEAYAASIGLSAAAMEPVRPWLAVLNLSVVHMMSEGFDPSSGIDQVLHQEALARGTELRFLEEMEFQIRLFSDLSAKQELDMLISTVDYADQTEGMLSVMLESWMSGDYDLLDESLSAGTREEYPEIYDIIFTNRNQTWTDEIVALMNEPGTFFIAVGSGHMGGPDGVPTMLRARGFTVE